MSIITHSEFQALQKRIAHLEERCYRNREDMRELDRFQQQLRRQVKRLESLMDHEYSRLWELYGEHVSRDERQKRYLI